KRGMLPVVDIVGVGAIRNEFHDLSHFECIKSRRKIAAVDLPGQHADSRKGPGRAERATQRAARRRQMQGRAGMLEALQAATKRVEADKTFAPTIDASAEAT